MAKDAFNSVKGTAEGVANNKGVRDFVGDAYEIGQDQAIELFGLDEDWTIGSTVNKKNLEHWIDDRSKKENLHKADESMARWTG